MRVLLAPVSSAGGRTTPQILEASISVHPTLGWVWNSGPMSQGSEFTLGVTGFMV